MYDAIIVGASLAGSATAIHLARAGRSVLLVDRAMFPRRKSCGEGMFPRGVVELDDLGVLPRLRGFCAPVSSLRFTMDGLSAEAPVGRESRGALGVQRWRLDEVMMVRAREIGVEVRLGVEAQKLKRVESTSPPHSRSPSTERGRSEGILNVDGRFTIDVDGAEGARMIVAADGLRSGLRRQAGLDVPSRGRRYGVSAHWQMAEPVAPRVDVFYAHGYEVYTTPVGERLLNVAVMMRRDRVRELGGRLVDGYKMLVRQAIEPSTALELVDEPLTVGPFPASAKAAWRDNLVLVGDAAGFFDGITGDGMSLALLSARRCAAAIDEVLTTGSSEPLRVYDRYRRRLARNSTLLGHLNLFLAAWPPLGRSSIRNLARHPGTFSKLLAINNGDLELAGLTPRDVLALAVGL